MSAGKFYRVFNGRRIISEAMLMDQMRRMNGTQTLAEMAAQCGMSPADGAPWKVQALCEAYGVPVRSAHVLTEDVAKRVALANLARLKEIAAARAEAAYAPLYRPRSS